MQSEPQIARMGATGDNVRAALFGEAFLVFLLKPNDFVGEWVLVPSEAPSQYAVRHSFDHLT